MIPSVLKCDNVFVIINDHDEDSLIGIIPVFALQTEQLHCMPPMRKQAHLDTRPRPTLPAGSIQRGRPIRRI
jgi:hypothetical protein